MACFGASSRASCTLFTVTCFASLQCLPPSVSIDEPAITMHLLRYFNSAPVFALRNQEEKYSNVDLDDSGMETEKLSATVSSCDVERAVVTIDWKRFGFV